MKKNMSLTKSCGKTLSKALLFTNKEKSNTKLHTCNTCSTQRMQWIAYYLYALFHFNQLS